MLLSHHSFTRCTVCTISPRFLCFSLSALRWSMVTGITWVKGKEDIHAGNSGSLFLPMWKNVLDPLSASKPEDGAWHLTFLCECSAQRSLYFSRFTFFILKIQLTSLEYCSGPADLIILSSLISLIISAWSYLTHTPQPENACEGQTVPFYGKGSYHLRAASEMHDECYSLIFWGICQSCYFRFRCGITDYSGVAVPVSKNVETATAWGCLENFITHWVSKFSGPEPFLPRSVPLSLSVTANTSHWLAVCSFLYRTVKSLRHIQFLILGDSANENKCQFSWWCLKDDFLDSILGRQSAGKVKRLDQ